VRHEGSWIPLEHSDRLPLPRGGPGREPPLTGIGREGSQPVRTTKYASLLLAIALVLSGLIAVGAGSTTAIGAKKERPIALTLTGDPPPGGPSGAAPLDVTGTFTGTVGGDTVSGTYTGRFTLGDGVECVDIIGIFCDEVASSSFTFTFSGKDGSFTAAGEPAGVAGWTKLGSSSQWGLRVDLESVSGTRRYSPARGQFTLRYISSYYELPITGEKFQQDSGTLEGYVR
jgi:hypothetical protein